MRASFLALALALSLLTTPAAAAPCARDVTPAATLLLPYFEVDLKHPLGPNTTLTVRNVAPDGALVKANLFSDLGLYVGGFNFYLEPRASQELSLRDVVSCVLPSHPAPPSLSTCEPPAIPLSSALCEGFRLDEVLRGKPSSALGGLCGGADHGDGWARGYLTLDVVHYCSLHRPGETGAYFQHGGYGIASNRNVLTGDFRIESTEGTVPFSAPLVHIEARATEAELSTVGSSTFYGAWVGYSAADNREPLGSLHGPSFRNDGDVATDLLVWRDPETVPVPFSCGSTPAPFPLNSPWYYLFDEAGGLTIAGGQPFPLVAQRVRVGSPALPAPASKGWFRIGFDVPGLGAPVDEGRSQAWIGVHQLSPTPNLNASFEAPQLDESCTGALAYP